MIEHFDQFSYPIKVTFYHNSKEKRNTINYKNIILFLAYVQSIYKTKFTISTIDGRKHKSFINLIEEPI